MFVDQAATSCRAFLRKRADFLDEIRRFFRFRDVLEVDTPILSSATATDPQLDSFECNTGDGLRYLLTSPEHAMKRLLAEGSGAIYQMGKVFRRGEIGSRHNPEFTMLEWYRPGFSLEALQVEVIDLLRCLGMFDEPRPGIGPLTSPVNSPITSSVNSSASQPAPSSSSLKESVLKLTYREAFIQACGFDPFYTATNELCRQACVAGNMSAETFKVNGVIDRDATLDLLVTHKLEPWLKTRGIVVLTDFPASQAALAVVRVDEYGHPVAKRFELYINGMEIANAYEELTNPKEQRLRFEADNARRRELGKAEIPVDERLLACLEDMPFCAGIALGVDRLFMQKEAILRIDKAIPFGWSTI